MTTTTADVEAYAARVRSALADLPAPDRDDLLADLADHLAEVAAEDRLGELGTPEDYAAELRSSAGLPAPAAAPTGRRGPAVDRWLAATRDFLPELLPGWWVVRALLLTTLLTGAAGGAALLWLTLAVPLVPASVLLGRWFAADRSRFWLGIALDVVVGLFLVIAVGTVSSSGTGTGTGTVDSGVVAPPAPDLDGVTNLYPYDSQGRPLTGVLLYDQDGNPVQLQADTDPDGNRILRVPRYDSAGRVVGNVYPQEQTVETYPDLTGTPTVRRVPAPTVRPPSLTPR